MMHKNQKRQREKLIEFKDLSAMFQYLTSPEGDLDTKDNIYRVLVIMAQEDKMRELALTMLFLGLWPGLTATYGRMLKFYRNNTDELISDMWNAFVTVIQRADVIRINRVSATLIRNTERTVLSNLKQRWAENDKKAELHEDDSFADHTTPDHNFDISDLGLLPGHSINQKTRRLEGILTSFLGKDAELFIGAAIHGENLRELGAELGLSHENARKRFQRARKRLQKNLKKNEIGCPRLAS